MIPIMSSEQGTELVEKLIAVKNFGLEFLD